MNVEFLFEHADYKLLNTESYSNWLNNVAVQENRVVNRLVYHFVAEEVILEINRNFLNHDYITDIITFDNSFLNNLDGEIFICVDEVERNAERHDKRNSIREMNRVIVHGLLHLIGYKDKTSDEKNKMRMLENKYISLLD